MSRREFSIPSVSSRESRLSSNPSTSEVHAADPHPPGGTQAVSPILLSGPTASGKSAVALELALRMGGEILSADSMQVYRGLDIGTAKPTPADRARVPHHLLDLVDPGESFSAGQWLFHARAAVADVIRRGRIPIFCGGTGLYFKVWLDGLAPPAPDPVLRAGIEATPLDVLLDELAAKDPETFSRIDRRNPRRVRRAVEILRSRTGAPAESIQKSPDTSGNARVIVLRRDPADLRRRIDARVDEMFAAGLVDEVRHLMNEQRLQSREAMQAIGYRQVIEHLRGPRDLTETIALVKTRTWQFARRQMTWFRHQLPVVWLDVTANEGAMVIADRIMHRLGPANGRE